MIQIWRIIIAGARNFLRNAWLSTAATAVMTVTLTIILLSYILNSTFSETTKQIVSRVDISVYMKTDVTPEQIQSLQTKLLSIENVQSARLVSKSEALLRFREQNKDNPSVRDSITEAENPLPPSFDVEVKDKSKLTFIEEFIKQPDVKPLLDDKDPTSYQGKKKDTVNSILKVSNFLQIAGLISSILSTIISILIIFNTIRMAIFTRKQEIEIMKLVGATNWFIRGPFIFEAAMYGIIGAVVATSLGYVLLLSGGPKLSSYGIQTGPILDYFRHYPIFIIGGELLIGILIGGISSLLAMSRYLKLE